MGQQQILLLIVSTVVVVIAVSVGIVEFRSWSLESNRAEMLEEVQTIRTLICEYRAKPKMLGGGGGIVTDFQIPGGMKQTDAASYEIVDRSLFDLVIVAHSSHDPGTGFRYHIHACNDVPCGDHVDISFFGEFGEPQNIAAAGTPSTEPTPATAGTPPASTGETAPPSTASSTSPPTGATSTQGAGAASGSPASTAATGTTTSGGSGSGGASTGWSSGWHHNNHQHWTPPGLANKGGIPPGQQNKN